MEHKVTTDPEQAGKQEAIEHGIPLYVRQVIDERLPATEVLPEIGETRGIQGPAPIFVP